MEELSKLTLRVQMLEQGVESLLKRRSKRFPSPRKPREHGPQELLEGEVDAWLSSVKLPKGTDPKLLERLRGRGKEVWKK